MESINQSIVDLPSVLGERKSLIDIQTCISTFSKLTLTCRFVYFSNIGLCILIRVFSQEHNLH